MDHNAEEWDSVNLVLFFALQGVTYLSFCVNSVLFIESHALLFVYMNDESMT